MQGVPLQFTLQAGQKRRVIDLAGNERVLETVVFVDQKAGGGLEKLERATVSLWGWR